MSMDLSMDAKTVHRKALIALRFSCEFSSRQNVCTNFRALFGCKNRGTVSKVRPPVQARPAQREGWRKGQTAWTAPPRDYERLGRVQPRLSEGACVLAACVARHGSPLWRQLGGPCRAGHAGQHFRLIG